jgi:hypothetical protein
LGCVIAPSCSTSHLCIALLQGKAGVLLLCLALVCCICLALQQQQSQRAACAAAALLCGLRLQQTQLWNVMHACLKVPTLCCCISSSMDGQTADRFPLLLPPPLLCALCALPLCLCLLPCPSALPLPLLLLLASA